MSNTIKNAFHPPRHVTVEIQDFIADNERLFPKKTGAGVGVVWSYPSNYWREAIAGYSNTIESNADKDLLSYHNADMDSPNSSRLPFWEVIRKLSESQVSYDVLMAADGDLRTDDFSIDKIQHLDMLILPDCTVLTAKQCEAFVTFAKMGKKLLIFGRVAESNPGFAEVLKQYDNVLFCDNPIDKPKALAAFWDTFIDAYCAPYTVSEPSLGVQMYRLENGNTALHFINYDYDQAADRVSPKTVTVTVNSTAFSDITVHVPAGEPIKATREDVNGKAKITLHDLPVYAVLEIDTAL